MKKQDNRQQEIALRAECVEKAIGRYTTHNMSYGDDIAAFKERNREAIAMIVEKGYAISGLMTGLRGQKNPDKVYDAKIELQRMAGRAAYADKETGEWVEAVAAHYVTKLHIKKEKLDIRAEISLPTNLKEEFIRLAPLQTSISKELVMDGDRIKVSLNEEDITHLRNLGYLRKGADDAENKLYLEGRSNHVYRVKPYNAGGKLAGVTVEQRQKITLSPADVAALEKDGRLNHTLTVGEGVNQRKYFVAVDKELNSMAFAPISSLRIPNNIYGVALSVENKQDLMEGKKIELKGVSYQTGKTADDKPIYGKKDLNTWYDPTRKYFAFEPANKQQQPAIEESQALKNVQAMQQNNKQQQVQTQEKKQGQRQAM